MLRAFLNIFKIPDLRGKLLFTLGIIAVYRLGAFVPIPGVDYGVLQAALDQATIGGAAGLVNLFSGGALTQLAVFALGIMPYITASIIMQLLTVVVPKVEEWKKEGETGQQKITQWTRYLTVVLAVLQSTGLVVLVSTNPSALFGGGNVPVDLSGLIPDSSLPVLALMVLTLTAGTAFVMWLGELITQRGIGNGMSLIIFSAIVASLPGQGTQILQNQGQVFFGVTMLVGLLLIVGVVFVELGQRRIPVQYAKRQVGRRTYGGQSSYIPLKLNQSGVIPIIFASSLLYLPSMASFVVDNPTFTRYAQHYMGGDHAVFIATYFVLTVFFAYFYTAITFNPVDVADNMKKYGGFIPGIRPGRPTAEYLDKVLTRLTTPGSLYLACLAVLPLIVLAAAGVQFPFGGATLLIVVGVALQTVKQLESQLMQRHYEGFLKR